MNPDHPFRARLVESMTLAPDARHFVFEVVDASRFDFEPGQHVCLLKKFGEEAFRRCYSVASAPEGTNRFELCIRPVSNGRLFGDYLGAMQPGDELDCLGPGGKFSLADPLRDSLFLAAGTGITPLRSMLKQLLAGTSDLSNGHEITLLFGARDIAWLYYREEFEDWERHRANFHFAPTLSRPGDGWQGRQGYVQSHLDEALDGRSDVDAYLCGPKAMVADVRSELAQRGFDERAVHYEKL